MKQDEFIKEYNEFYNKDYSEILDYKLFNFINHLLSKQPSGVSEVNDDVMDLFISKYIERLPKDWRKDIDMGLAMKNAMLEALSYPNKYTSLSLSPQSDKPSGVSEGKAREIADMFFTAYGKEVCESDSNCLASTVKHGRLVEAILSLSPKSDAVEFAEWLTKEQYNRISKHDGIVYWAKIDNYHYTQTTQELFTQYLKEK